MLEKKNAVALIAIASMLAGIMGCRWLQDPGFLSPKADKESTRESPTRSSRPTVTPESVEATASPAEGSNAEMTSTSPTEATASATADSTPEPTRSPTRRPSPTPSRQPTPTATPTNAPTSTATESVDTTGPSIGAVTANPDKLRQKERTSISCKVSDPSGISLVWLYWKHESASSWYGDEMYTYDGVQYWQVIPPGTNQFEETGIHVYYVRALDGEGNASVSKTHEILVTD